MSFEERFDPPAELAKNAHITAEKYKELYNLSVSDPKKFWEDMAKRITWEKFPTKIKSTDFTRCLHQMVRRRYSKCLLQLYRPSPATARQSNCIDLRR